MAWADASQRLEAMPTARTGCDFAVSDCPALSAPATTACRCRCQSLTAGGMIYDHVSTNLAAERTVGMVALQSAKYSSALSAFTPLGTGSNGGANPCPYS